MLYSHDSRRGKPHDYVDIEPSPQKLRLLYAQGSHGLTTRTWWRPRPQTQPSSVVCIGSVIRRARVLRPDDRRTSQQWNLVEEGSRCHDEWSARLPLDILESWSYLKKTDSYFANVLVLSWSKLSTVFFGEIKEVWSLVLKVEPRGFKVQLSSPSFIKIVIKAKEFY